MPLKRAPQPRDRGSIFTSTGANVERAMEAALDRLDGTRARIRELAALSSFTEDQEREWRALAKRYRKARRQRRETAAAIVEAKAAWAARSTDERFLDRWERRAAVHNKRYGGSLPPTTDDVRSHFIAITISKGHRS